MFHVLNHAIITRMYHEQHVLIIERGLRAGRPRLHKSQVQNRNSRPKQDELRPKQLRVYT
jgi:hypothetical protein